MLDGCGYNYRASWINEACTVKVQVDRFGRLNTVQKARALEVMAQGQNILSDAQVMLLGCTELSLLYPELQGCSTPWIDPLTVVANAAVQRAATSISLES